MNNTGKKQYDILTAEQISSLDNSVVWQLSDENGRYQITAYGVFPGIEVVYSNVQVEEICFDIPVVHSDHTFEIAHCREGRLECTVNDAFFYLAPGDFAIVHTNQISSYRYFPLGHFYGVTIRIDPDQAPDCFSHILEGVTVQPKKLLEKFCKENNSFVIRSDSPLAPIFSELYVIPQEMQHAYIKVKILELLLKLSVLEEREEKPQPSYSYAQVALAKKIGAYLMEHLEERITMDALAAHFQLSATHIKNTFKGVYGVSPSAYIRTQKMESAAHMLEFTDKSILEIAGEHGYDNGSKFANAFRSVKGISPNAYRNRNKK